MRNFIDVADPWLGMPRATAEPVVRLVQDDHDGVYDDLPVKAIAAA